MILDSLNHIENYKGLGRIYDGLKFLAETDFSAHAVGRFELAEDMFRGCPMMKDSRIFDIEWDEKYNTVQLSCALHKK